MLFSVQGSVPGAEGGGFEVRGTEFPRVGVRDAELRDVELRVREHDRLSVNAVPATSRIVGVIRRRVGSAELRESSINYAERLTRA